MTTYIILGILVAIVACIIWRLVLAKRKGGSVTCSSCPSGRSGGCVLHENSNTIDINGISDTSSISDATDCAAEPAINKT